MKTYWTAQISVLIIGLAVLSPKVMAQSTPASAVLPSADVSPVPPSSRALYQSPILAYAPPTEREKLRLFAFDAFGPYALLESVAAGGYQQEAKAPPEWGSGWSGYGERVGSNFGIDLVTTTTRYGMAEVLREDAAYYRCGCRGFFPRLSHALISTLIARRGKDGHTVFSLPGLVAPYAGTMAELAWYPSRYSVKDGFRDGNYNLAIQAAGNLAMEFIYGGPHTWFTRLGRANSPRGTTADPNP